MDQQDPREAERLEALERYRILDTDPESGFDDLALLASQICDAPIALITLVDATRQWFKARIGVQIRQTNRDVAFCRYAIRQPELFVVPDTLTDERFRENPLVVGEPHIRFYAGAPLITREGHALGTLCVIDREPRTLTHEQLQSLEALRRQAVAQLELRRNLIELRDALERRDAAEADRERLVEELQESLENVEKLTGMLPLCSACRFEMVIPADPAQIGTVADGVLQVLRDRNWGEEREFQIETALREALANAIRHGCENDPSKRIQCVVTCDDSGEVVIVVRDPGAGFEVDRVPDPLKHANRLKSSGRGIYLINQLMDDVRYADGGREIHMRKRPDERGP